MRFVTGLVMGAVLVVGAAYIHDASLDLGKHPDAKAMVNWPVVSDSLRTFGDWFRDQMDRLGGKLDAPR